MHPRNLARLPQHLPLFKPETVVRFHSAHFTKPVAQSGRAPFLRILSRMPQHIFSPLQRVVAGSSPAWLLTPLKTRPQGRL